MGCGDRRGAAPLLQRRTDLTPASPRSTSSRSPAPSRAARLLPTARGPVGVAFAQGPRGCLTANVSLPGGVRARVLLPRWGDAVTVVRADGAAAVSEIEGGGAVVAGVAPGARSLTRDSHTHTHESRSPN